MKRWRERLGIVVAGTLAGAGLVLFMQHAVEDPSTLEVASPVFAGDMSSAAKRSPVQSGGVTQSAGVAQSVNTQSGGVTKSTDTNADADPVDRLSAYVRQPYYYGALGHRDPFASLVKGEFLASGEAGLVDVGNIKLVGIAWDEIDRFAMVEDGRGFGFALREGDAIRGGKVYKIDRESVTFVQNTAGVSNTITIDLPVREGE